MTNIIEKIEKTLNESEKVIKETDEFLEMMQFSNNIDVVIDYSLLDDIINPLEEE